jgi:hypothetical protein
MTKGTHRHESTRPVSTFECGGLGYLARFFSQVRIHPR